MLRVRMGGTGRLRGCGALVALALLAARPSAAFDVIGQSHVDLAWTGASGPVAGYAVYVARDGAFPDEPEATVAAPGARVAGEVGEAIRVRVAAFDAAGLLGPLSEESEEIRFVAAPPPPPPEPDPEPEPDPAPDPEPDPEPAPQPGPGALPGDSEARSGDFDGDGSADLFWRDGVTGANELWLLPSPERPVRVALPEVEDLDWQVAAVGDFDADGHADLFWRNSRSGENAVWWMDGEGMQSEAPVDPMSGEWRVAGSGDLDGDARADLAWQRHDRSETAIWLMRGADPPSVFPVAVRGSRGRLVAAVDDHSGDGRADLLWLDPGGSEVAYWPLGAGRLTSLRAAAPGPEWSLATSGDFDGDARADLLWARPDGSLRMWLLHGSRRIRERAVEAVDAGWELAGVGDSDGDGRVDLVWLHRESGSVVLWRMEGAGVAAELVLAPPA